MMQANEETGNRRPVMISLTETPKPVLDTKENKSDDKSSDEEMKDVTDQIQKTSTENSDQAEQTKTNQLLPKLKKLSDVECSTLLHACVSLMGLSVDADALNAILRLLLRLTQDFEQAVVFAQLGGVKMLLDLTQASSFSGFSSLATLLIRHVMEDPVTLRQTMEKVIRSSTVNSSSSNTKELHYLLACLAPAACRSPKLFAEVAREILRVDFNLLKKTAELDEDKRLLLKSLPAKATGNSSSNASSTSTLHEVSRSVICDLLNFLVRSPVEVPEVKKASENVPNDVSHRPTMSGANRTQQVIVRNSSSIELQVSVPEGAVPSETTASKAEGNEAGK